MKDFNWAEKVEKIKELLQDRRVRAVIVILLLAMVALGAYFGYWVKRPIYSMNIIRNAIAKRDMNTFNYHVDIEGIYSKAYDDIIAVSTSGDTDEFTHRMALGLTKQGKDSIVTRMRDNTFSAFRGDDLSLLDFSPESIYTGVVKIFCESLQGKENGLVYSGFKITRQEDFFCEADITFTDVKAKKKITANFRFERLPEGKWRIVRFRNIRVAFRGIEHRFDDSAKYYEMYKKLQEKREAIRRDLLGEHEVLDEKTRYIASRDVWTILRNKATKIEKVPNGTMYRFISSASLPSNKTWLSVYNDFIVANDGTLKKTAALVLSTAEDVRTNFDKIYFTSMRKGFMIDVNAWEKEEIGARGKLNKVSKNTNEDLSMAFLTTTDGLEDAYALAYDDFLFITFYDKDRTLAEFSLNEKAQVAIRDVITVNNIIKEKLYAGNGEYKLMDVPREETLSVPDALDNSKKGIRKAPDGTAVPEGDVDIPPQKNADKDGKADAKADAKESAKADAVKDTEKKAEEHKATPAKEEAKKVEEAKKADATHNEAKPASTTSSAAEVKSSASTSASKTENSGTTSSAAQPKS